jgi:hypothetical protein
MKNVVKDREYGRTERTACGVLGGGKEERCICKVRIEFGGQTWRCDWQPRLCGRRCSARGRDGRRTVSGWGRLCGLSLAGERVFRECHVYNLCWTYDTSQSHRWSCGCSAGWKAQVRRVAGVWSAEGEGLAIGGYWTWPHVFGMIPCRFAVG